MTRLFHGLALFVAVACFTWVAVLWHWQATQREMSVEDIGLYLVALPLVLFSLLLLGRWAWRGARPAPRATDTAADAVPAAAGAAPPSPDEADRRATVQLLAAALHCRAGRSAAEAVYAIGEGQPRPSLDPELRDDEGLPLMSARVPDLDLTAAAVDPTLAPEVQRALAALAEPLRQALSALQPWHPQFGLGDDPAAAQAAQGSAVLRVAASWPPDWSEVERGAADRWLLGRVRAALDLRPERLATLALPPGPAWPEVERLLRLLDRDARPDVLLLAAAHSAIGERSVRRGLAAGQIFTSRSASRPIVGEAAAVLLLAPPALPPSPEAEAPPLRLHRAAVAQRDKSIDDPGRTQPQVARHCIEQALACAALPAEQLAAAVHDADQHTPRAAEALTALLQALPDLAPADDVLQTGALNGHTGVAAPLIAIALAAHQAAQLDKPCLALSVDDARLRLALVARPANFEPAAPAAPAA